MMQEEHILVVDDDPILLETICEGILMHGFDVIPAKSPTEALRKIENKNIEFALLDLDLGSPEMNGIELGHKLKEIIPDIFVLIMTGYHNVQQAVKATKEYQYYHMIKPFQVDQLLNMMERIKRERQLERENKRLKQQIASLEEKISRLLDEKDQETPKDTTYIPKKMESNALHSTAVKSYEKQIKHKSINTKKMGNQ